MNRYFALQRRQGGHAEYFAGLTLEGEKQGVVVVGYPNLGYRTKKKSLAEDFLRLLPADFALVEIDMDAGGKVICCDKCGEPLPPTGEAK